MAAASVLSTASGPGISSDFTVTAPTVLCLRGPSGTEHVAEPARVDVQLKDEAGGYWGCFTLSDSAPVTVIVGPGTYRLVRRQGTCGAFTG